MNKTIKLTPAQQMTLINLIDELCSDLAWQLDDGLKASTGLIEIYVSKKKLNVLKRIKQKLTHKDT